MSCRMGPWSLIPILAFAVPLMAQTPAELAARAEQQAQAGDLHAAVKSYRQFFQSAPRDDRYRDAQLRLGQCLLEIGEPIQACRVFEEFVQQWPGDPREKEYRLKTARAYEARGDFPKAIALYRDYLGRYPEDPQGGALRLYLCRIYEEVLHETETALREYRALLEEAPDPASAAELQFAIARVYENQAQDFLKAREAYTLLVEKYPQHPLAARAQLKTAELSDQKGVRQYAVAVSRYRAYLEKYPDAPDREAIWTRLAQLYLERLKQFQNAADADDQVLRLHDTPETRLAKLRALEKTHDPDRILPAYEDFMKRHGQSAEARAASRTYASLLWDLDRKEESLAALARMVELHPESLEDRLELAQRQKSAGQFDAALQTYQQAAARFPSGDLFVAISECPLGKAAEIREKQKGAGAPEGETPDTPEIQALYAQAEALLKDAQARFPSDGDIVCKASWQLATAVYEPRKEHSKVVEALAPIFERFPSHAHYAAAGHAPARLLDHAQAASQLDRAEGLLRRSLARFPGHARLREALAELAGRQVRLASPPPPPAGRAGESDAAAKRDPAEAKARLEQAVRIARDVLLEDDSDAAAALALGIQGAAWGLLGEVQPQLTALAAMARLAAHPALRGLGGFFDEIRKGQVSPLLEQLSFEKARLEKWRFRRDPDNAGEKESWVTAPLDAAWGEMNAGQDWGGDFDGYGWYRLDFPHSGTPDPYTLIFEGVQDEAWVYVNGVLSAQHSGGGSFRFPFTVASEDQPVRVISLVVRVLDRAGPGGLTGGVLLLKPRKLEGLDLFRAGLCQHALGRWDQAMSHYKAYEEGGEEEKKVPEGQDEILGILSGLKLELILLQGDLEKAEALLPDKPEPFVLLRLAQLLEAQREPERALERYRQARALAPGNLRCIRELAEALDRRALFEEEVAELLAMLGHLPAQADPTGLQEKIIWVASDRWRNVTRARELAEQFNRERPAPSWERVLGDLYRDRDPRDYARSIEHYQKYMGYQGKEAVDVWHGGLSLWDLYNRLQRYDEAIAYARTWRETFSDHPRALEMAFRAGQTHLYQNRPGEAAKVFTELVEKYPDSEAAVLCTLTAIDAFTADARNDLVQKWFERNPGNPRAAEIYFRLGQRYEPERDGIPRAIEAYRVVWDRFRDKWSENLRAADRLSHLLLASGQVEAGSAVAEQVRQKFGNQAHAEVSNAWYRLLDHYGPRLPFHAEVDTTFSTGTSPGWIHDGITDGERGNPARSWLSDVSPRPHWVDCVLHRAAAVHRVRIYWGHAAELPKAYKLQVLQGNDFRDVPGFERARPAEAVLVEHRFSPVTTTAIRILQQAGGGSPAMPNQMMVAEVQLYELQPPESVQRYLDFVGEMTRQYANRPEAFEARKHLIQFYRLRGDDLQANLEIQRMVYNAPREEAWHWDSLREFAAGRMREKRYGEAAAILRSLLRLNPKFADKNRIADAEKLLGEALTESGSGALVIDAAAPEAGLLWGNAFALSGEEELAWQRYQENLEIFAQHQHKLSAEYLRLIVRHHLASKAIKPAVEICSAFLARREADPLVADSDKAMMQILLGDCFYRDERYEIAREHYTAVANRYPALSEGIEARFKIATVFIAQKLFDQAREILADLLDHPERDTVIRAHILMGILYHSLEEKKAAADEFRTVLMMSPNPQTADEIIFRLGSVYHEQGRYKEAVDTLKLIGAWSGESRRVVDLGGEMRIRVSDQDLNITRGSLEVPVIVQGVGPDGKKRDRERVILAKSEAGAGLFVGSIQTRLGEPESGDHVLQVSGSDVLTYYYDPDFAKDFVLEDAHAREFTLRVAADGRLLASASEIPEEEEAKVEIRGDLFEDPHKKRREFRDATQVKPGNNIYLRVVDLDLDRSSEPDTVRVEVTASSGDVVRAALQESGPHTGKFNGLVRTGVRPPDAIASDFSEAHEAIYAIDGDPDPQKSWMGLMDGQAPKWLQIDLKEVFPVDRVVWHRGTGARDREPIRYQVQTSADNKSWQTVATVPESWNYHDKLVYGPLRVRTLPNYIGDPKVLRDIMDMCELAPRVYGEARTPWIHDDEGNPFGPDEYYIAVLWGNLWCPETGTYEFAVDSDDASFLLVDGELVAEFPGNHAASGNWSHSGKILLQKGLHKITCYFQEWEIVQVLRVAWRLPSRSNFEIIPKEFFDPARYPELNQSEKLTARQFEIQEAKEGHGAALTFAPRPARFVRFLIDEFHSDAPAIALLEVWSGDRKIVPTPGVRIHELARNETLELTPGDAITASYTDEVNVEPGTPVIHRQKLSVTYYNGSMAALTRQWQENEATGERKAAELLTQRVNAGDPFLVRIVDYDMDTSDGIDKAEFVVRTLRAGEETKWIAKETEPFSGIFEAELRTSAKAQAGCITLGEGEAMEIAFVDRENTLPGNPTERTWKVVENVPTLGRVRVIPFGRDAPGEEQWQDHLRLISLDDGLTVEVVDPDQCLHEGSTIRVRLDGSFGKDTAIVECKVAGASTGVTPWEGGNPAQLLDALGLGLFRGHIKTLLGDEKSPDFVVQAAGLTDEESVYKIKSPMSKRKGQKDEPTVPVLNVSGQDLITVTYVDQESPDNPLETEVHATARILSNGTLGFFDDKYEENVEAAHVGESFFLQVTDFDADTTGERDQVQVQVETSLGDALTLPLTETLSHSGVFNAAVPLVHALAADPANQAVEADYGSRIRVLYLDERNTEAEGPAERVAGVDVVAGTDGVVAAFSKKYPDDKTAMETEFKIGECFFNLGREHLKMKKPELGRKELDEGRQILRDLLTYFPDAEIVDQAAFMLGNLDAEEQRYDDAIVTYRRITRDHADSPVAPEAQFAMAKAFESKGEFDRACEEYVRLAYKYPDSPLLADAMIRIGIYFFDKKDYRTAISVFGRFTDRFPDHSDSVKVYFKMGLAYILGEAFLPGAEHFKGFIDKFPQSDLVPAAMYWAGDAFLKGQDARKAYQMFKRCTWDYPETKWAKYARGRLTSPVFDHIAEEE
ncbi:MAG: tetratricopeptide repeat protein [Planctomycetes bacterium]|nr:tetratricopeptide repeat protein [Planctomycetota bacterium]